MKITMYNGVKVDNYFYFVCFDMNLLCCWDINNHSMDIIGSAPEEPIFKQGLFGNIFYADGTLFLIPFNADFLWKYRITDGSWGKVQLPETGCKEYKFYGGVIKSHYLYLLGYNYPAILKMDINTCEIKMIEIKKDVLQQDYLYSGILGSSFYTDDRYIVAPILCDNIILKIDTVNDTLQYIPISGSKMKCVGLAFDGEKYWLAPRYGNKYLIWDGDSSFKEKEIPGLKLDNAQYFGSCYIVGENIVFTSFIGNSIKRNLKKESQWEEIPKTFYFGKIISNCELILGTTEEEIWWYKDGRKQKITYKVDEKKYCHFLWKEARQGRLFIQSEVIDENEFFKLNNFIHLV